MSGKLCEILYTDGTRELVRYLAKLYDPWIVCRIASGTTAFTPDARVAGIRSIDNYGDCPNFVAMPDLQVGKHYSIQDSGAQGPKRLVWLVGAVTKPAPGSSELNLFVFQDVRTDEVVSLQYVEPHGWRDALTFVKLARSRRP